MTTAKTPLGVIECFFGSPWPRASRLGYASFLAKNGFDFYIYAPKADRNLRKNWLLPWNSDYRAELTLLAKTFQNAGVKFGVCLSPMGIENMPGFELEAALLEKIRFLDSLGLGYLGIFFDDMPVHPELAAKQIEVIKMVREMTSAKIIFCPTFYSYAPILDKVFGQRPPGYLEEIGKGIPLDVEIAWTGPLVISDEVSSSHLNEVASVLRRKPFVSDNIFANDGPKNCKFLKLKIPFKRSAADFAAASGWSVNPMNQPELSKIVLLALMNIREGMMPAVAFESALNSICPEMTDFILQNLSFFTEGGLEGIRPAFPKFNHPVNTEIHAWLQGQYSVGDECLTD